MTTITEALAELKTIAKRVEKKQKFIADHLCRQTSMVDPFVKEGGTPEVLKRESQALHDLEERLISIRRAIAKANAETTITVSAETRTIADWLVYRKEVATSRQGFISGLLQAILKVRAAAHTKGLLAVSSEAESKNFGDVVVGMDEMALNREAEQLEEILGNLDGLLSLKNATIQVTI